MSRCFLIVLLFRAILKTYRWMTNNFSSLIRSALAGPFIGIVPRIHTFPPATFLPLRKVLRTFPAFLSPRVVLTAVRYRWFQSLRWDRRPSSAKVTCAELCCFLFRLLQFDNSVPIPACHFEGRSKTDFLCCCVWWSPVILRR